MPTYFLNGRFLEQEQAPMVSALDAGLQHAVGLFETMLGGAIGDAGDPMGGGGGAGGGAWVMRLEEHAQRLVRSAAELELSDSLRAPALERAVILATARSGLARARIRLTITGGDLSLLRIDPPDRERPATPPTGARRGIDPTVLIAVQPAAGYPESLMERGVTVSLADARANPLQPHEGHKTLNYWWRLRELQRAGRKGAAEAIVLQVTNHLCGGCVSNVFLVKDGEVSTPIARGEEAGAGALPSPVLPGVTRSAVVEFAQSLGIPCRREMLSVNDLLDADEVFLTNSSWGVLPVVRVEGSEIGAGLPGPVTQSLRNHWMEDVASCQAEARSITTDE